jgi:hypothetical protein
VTGPVIGILEALSAMKAAADREQSLPPLGSEERPFELVVPGWYEDECIKQGTTAQQVADETLRYKTKVVVVR